MTTKTLEELANWDAILLFPVLILAASNAVVLAFIISIVGTYIAVPVVQWRLNRDEKAVLFGVNMLFLMLFTYLVTVLPWVGVFATVLWYVWRWSVSVR